MSYRILDRRCNWQNWTDSGFQSAPPEAILHWSGAGAARVSRAEQMRAWANRHPLFDPPPSSHEWEIDRTHALWLSDVLLSRKHRRVLEIGSFRGYSTRAFLHALEAGAVQEVHLCDVSPTLELYELVGNRCSIHETKSFDLLTVKYDWPWDLVLLDGDHSVETVTEEARLLIAQGCPAVFAHDTAHMDGPGRLQGMFEAAGYTCEVDDQPRPGERTDRGMLLATRVR